MGRAEAQRPDRSCPWHPREVKCLQQLELDRRRARAEQARDTAARQLAQAEQEGQAALQQLKSAHEEEVNQLQEKWVGGGCAQGMEGQTWSPGCQGAEEYLE